MDNTYWLKQTKDTPLFPDLLWSRPETALARGKLLIIGGNAHGFAVPAEAYSEAIEAGIGSSRVLLPDVLQRTVGSIFEVGEYAPSTPSGSFNQKALAQMLDSAQWADGVLIAGELGRNAETSAVLEKFLTKTNKLVTITKDAINNFNSSPKAMLDRENTTLVLSLAQLQRLGREASYPKAVTFDMDLIRFVAWLHEFSSEFAANILTRHLDGIFVAFDGQVSSTKHKGTSNIGRVKTAAHGAVWWLQNPEKPFEALTTSIITD